MDCLFSAQTLLSSQFPSQSIATITTLPKTLDSGCVYAWCVFEDIKGKPIGSIWQPDGENWFEYLELGMKVRAERLRTNSKYPDRIAATAMILADQTIEILHAIKATRDIIQEEEEALTQRRKSFSMPKASVDEELKNRIDNIAKIENKKASHVVRELCWEAICYRQAKQTSRRMIEECS